MAGGGKGWCVCVAQEGRCWIYVWERRLSVCLCAWGGVGWGWRGVTGENPIWVEASAGLHLTQHSARRSEVGNSPPLLSHLTKKKYLLAEEQIS